MTPAQVAAFPNMTFSLYEIKLIVAEVLRSVAVEPCPGYAPKTVRRGVALAPSGGMPLILTDRIAAAHSSAPAANLL